MSDSRLEELLRMRCKQGELNHISFVGGGSGGFDVIYRSTTQGIVRAVGTDPVAALISALEGREGGKLPRRSPKPKDKPMPTTRYWYHPESSCLFTTEGEDPREKGGVDAGHVEELDEARYREIEREMAAEAGDTSDFEGLL